MTNIAGKLTFIAIVLFFAAWCLIATRQEMRMKDRLEDARMELETATKNQTAAMESIENAAREKDEIHARIDQKKQSLQNALADDIEWSDINIPDDILVRLRNQNAPAKAEYLCPAGDSAGGCINTLERKFKNSGGYGASDSGGRGGDENEKR